MNNWIIRSLTAADLDEAARLHRLSFGFEAWDRKAITEVLAMPGAAGRIAVESPGGRALGFLLLLIVAADAELLTVAVPPDHRRHGVGGALIQDFLMQATARGAANAFLEVAEDNTPAYRLYTRLGFLMEGVRRDYYRRPGNKRVAARLLRRPLPQS